METNFPLYTDLEITCKGQTSLNMYLNSICRNLPSKWRVLKTEKYEDNDTFKILNNVVCLLSPWYKNIPQDRVFFSKIFLGLTDNSILILRIDFDSKIEEIDRVELIGNVIYILHEQVLKPNKLYTSFEHKFAFGGPRDENWHKDDLRDQRLIRFFSKKDNKVYSLSKGLEAKNGKVKILFNEPNNISLALSIMKKSFKKSYSLYTKLDLLQGSGTKDIKEKNKPILYDYFEEIITSLTFAYIAIESFSNAAIPENYCHEIINEKGIKEIWPKESIERWMTTSDKVSEILPKIFKSSNIKNEPYWSHFKELEKLRNGIIHQRTIEKGTKLDSEIYKILISYDIFSKIKSAISVIEFFYKLDNAHPFFPLGLGIATFQINEIDDIGKQLKPLDFED